MTLESVAVYLSPMGVLTTCTCKVERNEAGEIVLPDFNACAYTVAVHETAIKRAVEILERVPKRPKESETKE